MTEDQSVILRLWTRDQAGREIVHVDSVRASAGFNSMTNGSPAEMESSLLLKRKRPELIFVKPKLFFLHLIIVKAVIS